MPGDYEFLTLRQEIQDGATIEEMEYHWIDPGCDRRLQAGLDPDADDKQRAISCITVNGAGLQRFMELFRPDPAAYEKDDPYCSFPYAVQGQKVELVFRMNEAGLSKLNGDWLRAQKERLDSGFWSTCPGPGTGDGALETALFDLDYSVTLIYRLPGGEDLTFQVRAGEDGAPDRASMVLLKDGEPVGPAECYTQEEMEAVEEHIAAHFGPVENVFHELVSPDIHVDICVVEPSAERDYYTLVTMGMGARRMKVPEELAEYHLERAELAIALPPDWRLDAESLKDERWYWPIGLLKVLARLPIDQRHLAGLGPHPGQGVPLRGNYGPVRRHPDLSPGRGGGGGGLHPPQWRGGQFLPGDPPLSGRAGVQAAPRRRGAAGADGGRELHRGPRPAQRYGGRGERGGRRLGFGQRGVAPGEHPGQGAAGGRAVRL